MPLKNKKATARQNGPLRIAMLGHKRIPSREGGVEIVVGELSRRMAALGHGVTCYNRRGHHVGGAEFDREKCDSYFGVKIKEVPTLQKKGLAAMSSSAFAALFSALSRYDVVHFHAEGPCAMLWLPKLFGKKCVATIHGLDHQRAKWGRFASWYIKTGERCAARFADEVIVLSRGVEKYFLDTYGRKTVYIPNGINFPEHAEPKIISEKYGLSGDDYILYLGRLVPEKGIAYLIDAYKKTKTDKKLVIAGGSSDTDEYAKELHGMAEGDGRIVFTGFVEGRELCELYSNAYIYTLPSDLEGMPLSLLEAMSYGNCVLTSDIEECAAVTGEFGVTFRAGDKEELLSKLQTLCDDPAAVQKYKEGVREHVLSKYSWDDVTEKTLALYR